MALVPCTECGREVSDRAAACPQCGAPLRAPGLVRAEPSMEEWALSRLTAGSPRRQVVAEIVQHGAMLEPEAEALVKRVEGASLAPADRKSTRIVVAGVGAAIFVLFLLMLLARAG